VCDSDADLKALARAYDRGHSIRVIAETRGWSYGFTHARLLIAEGKGFTSIRSRGTRTIK